MKLIFIGAFFCILACNSIVAQSDNVISLHTINGGAGSRLIHDDYLSLNSKKISSEELGYTFSVRTAYWEKSISIIWGRGIDKDAEGQLRLNDITAEYSNAFSLTKNKTSRLNIFLGYSIAANVQYIKEDGKDSWTTINSLSLYNSSVYSWKKNSLSLDFNIPVAALASRPENRITYAGNEIGMAYKSYSNLFFASIDKLKAATISLKYHKGFGDRFQLNIGPSFIYKDLKGTYNFNERSFQLHAGLSYLLK